MELPCDMKYSDVAQGLSIDLKKGTVHLDGRLAEQFVRFRSSYVEGDLGRIDAQKIFIAALLEKISSEFSPLLAAKLVSCADGVETDLCAADMITLGTRVMSIDKGSIFLLTLPGQECVADVSGAWYYVLSGKATQRLMLEYFCASRDFDTQRVFLNENYDDFARIYNADMDYSMINVTRINEDGIDIHLKRK